MIVKSHRTGLIKLMENESIAILYSGIPLRSNADEYYDFEVNSQFFYLTGLERHGMALVLVKTGNDTKEMLFIDPYDPFIERWTGKMPTKEEVKAISGIEDVFFTGDLESMVNRIMSRYMIQNAYFDTSRESVSDLPDYNLVKATDFIKQYPSIKLNNVCYLLCALRRVKDANEIDDTRKAIKITDAGLKEVLKTLRPGLTEYQVQAVFEYRCRYEGAKRLAFPTISAAGRNACMMHYLENSKTIEDGELLLMDLGAKYHNYCSDITRTYPANGRFNDRQRAYYELVLKANKAVAKAAKPGVTLKELQQLTCSILAEGLIEMGKIKESSEISKYYMHSVSHSLGIDAHDINYGDVPMEAGWIISDEPGLYIDDENIGIRIEDDLLITENGCEVLSNCITKEVDEIEALMASIK